MGGHHRFNVLHGGHANWHVNEALIRSRIKQPISGRCFGIARVASRLPAFRSPASRTFCSLASRLPAVLLVAAPPSARRCSPPPRPPHAHFVQMSAPGNRRAFRSLKSVPSLTRLCYFHAEEESRGVSSASAPSHEMIAFALSILSAAVLFAVVFSYRFIVRHRVDTVRSVSSFGSISCFVQREVGAQESDPRIDTLLADVARLKVEVEERDAEIESNHSAYSDLRAEFGEKLRELILKSDQIFRLEFELYHLKRNQIVVPHCVFCLSLDHLGDQCSIYDTLVSREEFFARMDLCLRCAHRHGGSCTSTRRCGNNRCTANHHYSLCSQPRRAPPRPRGYL